MNDLIRAGEILPGVLYPNRCLECLELLRDDYGSTHGTKCVLCLAADQELRMRQLAREPIDNHARGVTNRRAFRSLV